MRQLASFFGPPKSSRRRLLATYGLFFLGWEFVHVALHGFQNFLFDAVLGFAGMAIVVAINLKINSIKAEKAERNELNKPDRDEAPPSA